MTDERMDQCKLCSHIRLNHIVACIDCDLQDQDPRYHSFEEAPSTDEGEARVNAPDKRGHFWFRQGTNMLGHSVWRKGPGNMVGPWWGTVEIPPEVEAAIRVPLEERIRELERQLAFWREESFSSMQTRDVYHSRAEAAEADNERLREALRALVDKILGPDEGSEAWDELVDLADVGMRALATPPSSTEGTKEGGE